MPNYTFENIVTDSQEFVKWAAKKKFNFDILVELYNDPSHFIFELLQNAEDEGATEIRFELFKDRLDFYHNAKKYFDLEDIEGITSFGFSKKKNDINSIGKFGIGFKSVYTITKTPFIFSGEYKFRIESFVIPSRIEVGFYPGTLIRLPFNHGTRNSTEVFEMMSKKLKNINLKTMLFLNNIEEINWKTPNEEGQYLREAKDIPDILHTKKVTIISSTITEQFLVIDRPINIDGKNLKVEVAYKLGIDNNNGKEIIIPENDSKLVVYFPTEKITALKFLIQGPFKTTPNRENIPLNDLQNIYILEETVNLVSESLTIVKDLGYLDVDFLNILPLDFQNNKLNPIYTSIYDAVKEKLFSSALLPTTEKNFAISSEVLLARGKELTEFLDGNDLNNLFSKIYWLDTNITYDRTRVLRDYLINDLKVPEIDFETFSRKISAEFLKNKSDEWMIEFYSKLLSQQSLWSERGNSIGILRNKPIIRLENNDHIAPFNYVGKLQVYLPSDSTSKYKTVKRSLILDEDALKFLKELGLSKPDLLAEINEFIIPKYSLSNITIDEYYYEDFEKILNAFEIVPVNKKAALKESISKIKFIKSKRNNTEDVVLARPCEIYFNSDELITYFQDNDNILFVADDLYDKFNSDKLNSILKELQVEDKPRRISNKNVAELSWDERLQLVGYTGREIYKTDYDLEGLEHFFATLSHQRSILLWQLLLNNLESCDRWNKASFFSATLHFEYRGPNNIPTESKFLKLLKKTSWLIDKNDNYTKSSDISFSELSDNFIKENSSIDILKKALGFKPEIIENLPDNFKRILEIATKNNITPEEFQKLINEKQKESSKLEEDVWTPPFDPDSVIGNIIEVESEKISNPDLSYQNTLTEGDNQPETPSNGIDTPENGNDKPKTSDRGSIGKWGEKHVFNTLKNVYKKYGHVKETETGFTVTRFPDDLLEIVWLNKNGEKGRGYDLVIKKNGFEIEYIEVKAKTQEDNELITANGAQWEFARRLFDNGNGDRYCFYVVKPSAEIKKLRNPIKLWKEGKLYAHPVNFKL
ncbi:MAG: sacsin N-terminal ATP-binding-like domain-containing protein [Ignavibacteriaceae bacterium]